MSSGTQGMLRPRRHLHRGTVRAVAFWFDPALLGEGEARRRVLAAWGPGASVHAVAEGYLLRLPRPLTVASDAAPGLPLTLEEGVLTSAPLSAQERERLAPREGSVVLVRAGAARVYAGAPGVDMAAWLDVSGWTVLPARSLGAPPPPVASALEQVAPVSRDSFGHAVPSPAPEAVAMMARMQGRAPPDALVAARPGLMARLRTALFGGPQAVAGGKFIVRRVGLLARLRASLFGARQDAASASGTSAPGVLSRLRAALRGGRAGSASALVPATPSLLSRLRASLFGARQDSASASGAASTGLLSKLRAAFSGSHEGSASVPGVSGPGLLGRLLASLFGNAGSASAGTSTEARKGTSTAAPAKPSGPGLVSRLSAWMLRNTPLGQLLGQRKAEYMRRLFNLFEEGNLQEALRYAIPLGKDLDENARVALGLPGPREQLTIRTSAGGGAASVFGGGEALFNILKERYRDAFRRLEREGRIDEAAFVLAELLGAHEEAVSFLERHGRFKLAAELAESRNLPPGLVVRQWFLAKDIARASAIARRSGAFADAVSRLERTHAHEARALRQLWAETLAESGDWARAVQTVWPLHDARALARGWVERGVECGGASGARLLALWVSAFPDGLEAARGRVLELLEDDSPERAPERFAFALTLAGESSSQGRTALVAPTARALLRDLAAHRSHFSSEFLTRLLRDAPDGTLRADLPPLTERQQRSWREDPSRPQVRATVRASDEGAFAVHDAVALPDGRLLLALGEAGARLVRADGRAVAHFDVPAFALVPSIHGDRALALAPRGEVHRLSRLDLVEHRATTWCDAPVDAWASTYDGNVWFIASKRTVMMVDALAADLRALWRVPDVPAPVVALEADATHLSFLTLELERWAYELNQGPTLRSRAGLRPHDGASPREILSSSLTPDGEVAVGANFPPSTEALLEEVMQAAPPRPRHVRFLWLEPLKPRVPPVPEFHGHGRVAFIVSNAWRVDVARRTGCCSVFAHQPRAAGQGVALDFEGDTVPRVRLGPGALLAFDTCGRLLWVDLERGSVRHVAVA